MSPAIFLNLMVLFKYSLDYLNKKGNLLIYDINYMMNCFKQRSVLNVDGKSQSRKCIEFCGKGLGTAQQYF
jgi:hypothetical protein